MPFARPNLTRRLPVPTRHRTYRPVQTNGGPGAPLGLVLGGWNYLARIWISFDPPTAALPTWIEITGFVETDSSITITRGRADGIGDVQAATCALTLDNSDGRFCPDNPNGAWFGLLDLGCWLKVDVLAPSGNVFDRFVGFTTVLPTGWTGQYASSQVAASDRYVLLAQAPNIVSMIQSEVLTDPNLAGKVKGYWNLHEPTGATTFGDTSGQGARYLAMASTGGVPVGTGFAANNAAGPGIEGLRTVTFNPPTTTTGTYLTGPITSPVGSWNYATATYAGLFPCVEFWFQATTANVEQPLVSLVDPVSQSCVTIYIRADGLLGFGVVPTVVGATSGAQGGILGLSSVADGNWHHVIFGGSFSLNAGTFYYNSTSILDGGQAFFSTLNTAGSAAFALGGTYGSAYTQLLVGAGWDFVGGTITFLLGASNISDVAFYWTDLKVGARIPNAIDHAAAGRTGNAGESTDLRAARIARYAGVPIPLQTTVPPLSGNGTYKFTTQTYNPSKGPWVNLQTGAHYVGAQSMAGRGPLDVLREAVRTEFMPPYTDRSGYLAMQPSTVRQNTSPAWTVDARDLDESTGDVKDFAYTTNQATITPNGQAAQTVIGPYGAASQAKYGQYTQGGSLATASLSPIEAQSLGYALVQQRYKPVSRLTPLVVEVATLATQAGYGTAWYDAVLGSEISTPIRVTNTPPQMGGVTSDVFLEGWTETLSAGTHTFSYSTSPIQGPTYQLDDAVLGHLDTDGSTLTVAVSSSATTLTVATTGVSTGSALWTTSASDFPFDLNIGGEQLTATAIANTIGGADGTFESGIAGWVPTWGSTGTWAASSAQAHTGTQSGLLSTSSSLSSMNVSSPLFAVAPNTPYTMGFWVLQQSGSGTIFGQIQWFDATFSPISTTTATGNASSPVSWTNESGPATSPSNAAWASVRVVDNVGTSGGIYIDDVTVTPSTSPQLVTAIRSVNGVVAAHAAGAAVSLFQPLTLAY